jgi:hypothetical protein
VLWPRKLFLLLAQPEPLTEKDVAQTHGWLASALPTA